MIRLAERQDLDRIMEIWLEGNLQAHDFVDPDYWTGCFQEVREAIAQADVWVWDENDRVVWMDCEEALSRPDVPDLSKKLIAAALSGGGLTPIDYAPQREKFGAMTFYAAEK